MEQVLRASDNDILVYVAPTKALVSQIAAEIYARFQKTFWVNGSKLLVRYACVFAVPHRCHRERVGHSYERLSYPQPTELSDPGNCPRDVSHHAPLSSACSHLDAKDQEASLLLYLAPVRVTDLSFIFQDNPR